MKNESPFLLKPFSNAILLAYHQLLELLLKEPLVIKVIGKSNG